MIHLCHKRKIERKKGKKRENVTLDDSILQLIKGMNYCYLIDNKPIGNSIVMNDSSIISQVEWNDGKMDGEVVIGDIYQYDSIDKTLKYFKQEYLIDE